MVCPSSSPGLGEMGVQNGEADVSGCRHRCGSTAGTVAERAAVTLAKRPGRGSPACFTCVLHGGARAPKQISRADELSQSRC